MLRRLPRFAALLLAVLAVAGCTQVVEGRPTAAGGVLVGPVDTSAVTGTDGGGADQIAAATLLDLQAYWEQAFPAALGRPWSDLTGGFHSVDTADGGATAPPCAARASDVADNAFYCEAADAIAWDRTILMPDLRRRFGDAAVVVVLAHEMGHAVHYRLGVDLAQQRANPATYPTILLEAMADCYAGAFIRWVTEGNSTRLRIGRRDLDVALGALVNFRDPVGTSASDADAHGNGFDRISSFQDGYEQGPALCAGFTVAERDFTEQQFTDLSDEIRGGNLPLDALVQSLVPDVQAYYGGVVQRRGGQWRPTPQLQDVSGPPDCSGNQGPAAFCPAEDIVQLDRTGDLARLHAELGDYATAVLLASRYGLAAMDALGRPVTGPEAGREAVCLAGSYSGDLLSRSTGFGLSPGDLDEAVLVLLESDQAGRDARGAGATTGFERVAAFRAGALGGAPRCLGR